MGPVASAGAAEVARLRGAVVVVVAELCVPRTAPRALHQLLLLAVAVPGAGLMMISLREQRRGLIRELAGGCCIGSHLVGQFWRGSRAELAHAGRWRLKTGLRVRVQWSCLERRS